ncbi:hypothetical protein NDU88_002740 [Pleurodeles waltl]|uniref:Uncharacterized protein n=1 Tax=Pleurodeles waltl TaxID=8319 RepID=A0AAV7SDL1_PLEWA|nr:hypothetical protein NDU88_002740 [Pleurodeles waltl]
MGKREAGVPESLSSSAEKSKKQAQLTTRGPSKNGYSGAFSKIDSLIREKELPRLTLALPVSVFTPPPAVRLYSSAPEDGAEAEADQIGGDPTPNPRAPKKTALHLNSQCRQHRREEVGGGPWAVVQPRSTQEAAGGGWRWLEAESTLRDRGARKKRYEFSKWAQWFLKA